MRFFDPINCTYKEVGNDAFVYLVEMNSIFFVKALTKIDKAMCLKCPTTRAEKIIALGTDKTKLSVFDGTYQIQICFSISSIPEHLKEHTLYLYLENEEIKIIEKNMLGEIKNFSLNPEEKEEIILAIKKNEPLKPILLDDLYYQLREKDYSLQGYLFDFRSYTREELLSHGLSLKTSNFSPVSERNHIPRPINQAIGWQANSNNRYREQIQYFLPLCLTHPALFDQNTLRKLEEMYEHLGHLPRRLALILNLISQAGLLDARNCSMIIQAIENYRKAEIDDACMNFFRNDWDKAWNRAKIESLKYMNYSAHDRRNHLNQLQREEQEIEEKCRERLQHTRNIRNNTNNILTIKIDAFLDKFISLSNRELLDEDIIQYLAETAGETDEVTRTVEKCWDSLDQLLTRDDMKCIINHKENFTEIFSKLEPEAFRTYFNKIKKIAQSKYDTPHYFLMHQMRYVKGILLGQEAVEEFFSLDLENNTPSRNAIIHGLERKISSHCTHLGHQRLLLLTQENFNILCWEGREFPVIQNLLLSLNAMYQHGRQWRLRYLPDPDNKVKIATELYLSLKKTLRTFMEQSGSFTTEKINSFIKEFRIQLHSKDNEMGQHRVLWKIIIANILLAIPLLFKLAYSKVVTGQFQFFFSETESIKHIKKIDREFNLIQEKINRVS